MMSSVELGSWPDWIAASVAFLAFIVAAVAAWATVKTNRAQQKALQLQQEQLNQQRQERNEDQARRISWWIDEDTINVMNLSSLPVFNLKLICERDYFYELETSQKLESGRLELVASTLKPNAELLAKRPAWFRDGDLLSLTDSSNGKWIIGQQSGILDDIAFRRALSELHRIQDEIHPFFSVPWVLRMVSPKLRRLTKQQIEAYRRIRFLKGMD